MAETARSIDAVLVRAARLSDEGRTRAAIAVLETALASYPDHPAAWCRLSAVYLEAGEARESLEAAKKAMTLGEPAWAHRLASLALVELGRHEEAVVSAGEAVRRAPEDWRGLVTLSEALAHDSPEQAVRAARNAVSLGETEPRTHEVLGDAAMLAHDWMLAEQAYTDALRLDPQNATVAAKLAKLAKRPADDARRRRRPVRSRAAPRFARVQRVAWFLAVRRSAVWQAVGLVVLFFAPIGWFALATLLCVAFLSWRGYVKLPAGARVPFGALRTRAPMVVAGVVALGLSYVVLAVWAGLLMIGSVSVSLLVVAFFCAVVAVANSSFGLWRMWSRDR
jgi:tetratricopeptide (TPR) repeat protein